LVLFLFLYWFIFFFFLNIKSIWHLYINNHFGIKKELRSGSTLISEKKREDNLKEVFRKKSSSSMDKDNVNESDVISNVYDGLMNNYERNKILLCSSSSDGTVKIWDLSSEKFINTCNIPNYFSHSNSAPLPKKKNPLKYSKMSPFFDEDDKEDVYTPNNSFLLTEEERNYFLSKNFEDRREEFS
jgi:hypothetical protein